MLQRTMGGFRLTVLMAMGGAARLHQALRETLRVRNR
jgi:hypothetical protein